MNIPKNLYYTKQHEWIKFVSENAIIGITDYAQSELGDIIFVELPSKGISVKRGESVGTIEAVKTVADLYTPLNGNIVEVNKDLEDKPESINKDPYESGWIIKLSKYSKDSAELLSASQYKKMIQ